MKDENGNVIAVTLFESYLSKFLIENQDFFKPVYLKILTAIEKLCFFNEDNEPFQRSMFSVFALVGEAYPDINSIDYLKNHFDLLPVKEFIKFFFDYVLKNKRILINYPILEKALSVPKLSVLCQQTLFEHREKSQKKITAYLRPPALFSSKDRGVIELSSKNIINTRKLGITTFANTPEELLYYFSTEHEPTQFDYKPNPKSNVGIWFEAHRLPIITGTSGSAHDYLALLFLIIQLSPREIQLLHISSAAILIARGHHSYFEIMILLDRFGFKLHSTDNLFEFYEQTLPKSIVTSEEYQSFKNSEHGSILINEITDCRSTTTKRFRELPYLFINKEVRPIGHALLEEEHIHNDRLHSSV